jgi:hypothetical protein
VRNPGCNSLRKGAILGAFSRISGVKKDTGARWLKGRLYEGRELFL